jgi:hypothetical protein
VSGTIRGLPVELAHLSWLVGRWEGQGQGQYPTIEPFHFVQQVIFSCDGRPFLSYHSRSWLLDDAGARGRPLATESGFWRPRPDNEVELLLSHPSGYAEVWEGKVTVTAIEDAAITGAQMSLRTDLVARTGSAKPYNAGHRLYGLVAGELLWTFDMAAMGEPLSNHLAVRLQPVLTGAADGDHAPG